MKLSVKAVCVLAIVMAAFVSSARADKVDNPAYKAWAKYKKGSTATYTTTMNVSGMSIEMKTVATLDDITPDHVTIEEATTTSIAGRGGQTNTTKQDVPAKVDDKNIKEDGEEDVKAMDKTFHCKVFEMAQTVPSRGGQSTTVNAKIWTNADVPGGMVQMKFTANVAGQSVEQTRTITGFDAK